MKQLAQLLGIDVPVIQAPIGSASCPAPPLRPYRTPEDSECSPVSWRTPDRAAPQGSEKLHALTQRPFGINLVIEWAPRGSACARVSKRSVKVVSPSSGGDPNGPLENRARRRCNGAASSGIRGRSASLHRWAAPMPSSRKDTRAGGHVARHDSRHRLAPRDCSNRR